MIMTLKTLNGQKNITLKALYIITVTIIMIDHKINVYNYLYSYVWHVTKS